MNTKIFSSNIKSHLKMILVTSVFAVSFSSCQILSSLLGLGLTDEGLGLDGSSTADTLGAAVVTTTPATNNGSDIYGLFAEK